MTNWKLNYYKKLKKFVELQIDSLESQGHVSDDEPISVFLSKVKMNDMFSSLNTGVDKKIISDDGKGLLSFVELLKILGNKESSRVFGIPEPTIKSWRYGQRQPTINQVKELIKLTNGSLIYESFFDQIDSPKFNPKSKK